MAKREPEESLVVVEVYNTHLEATMAKVMLENLGIPATLPDDQMSSQGMPLMLGGVRLVVPAAHADTARKALATEPREERP